jgi:hypothetical protein
MLISYYNQEGGVHILEQPRGQSWTVTRPCAFEMIEGSECELVTCFGQLNMNVSYYAVIPQFLCRDRASIQYRGTDSPRTYWYMQVLCRPSSIIRLF